MNITTISSGALWRTADDLCGVVQWDTLDDAAVELCAPGATLLLDWREIRAAPTETVLAITQRATAIAGRVVVMPPPGVLGILLAGVALAFSPTPPIVVRGQAAAVVALAHPRAAQAVAEVAAMAARARHAVLPRLRDELRRDPTAATVDSCARALGCSRRTLQRVLERAATTFVAEIRSARTFAAIELLAYTDTKIEAIAARTGFGTASRLSATLRREHRVTAGELRCRARGAQVTSNGAPRALLDPIVMACAQI